MFTPTRVSFVSASTTVPEMVVWAKTDPTPRETNKKHVSMLLPRFLVKLLIGDFGFSE
jgi:hypothetical protein